jgi:hypothetical protein
MAQDCSPMVGSFKHGKRITGFNKSMKFLVLKSSLRNIDVLCFTEHWVKADNLIQIDQ